MQNKDKKATSSLHRSRAFLDIEPQTPEQNRQNNFFSLKNIGFFAIGAAVTALSIKHICNGDFKSSKLHW